MAKKLISSLIVLTMILSMFTFVGAYASDELLSLNFESASFENCD